MDWDRDHIEDDAAEALCREALEAARSVVILALEVADLRAPGDVRA